MGQTKRRFHISTLVARGATRQQNPSYLNHPQLAIDRTDAEPAIVYMWATGHAVNMERIERWHLCECGMFSVRSANCRPPISVAPLTALFTGTPFVEV